MQSLPPADQLPCSELLQQADAAIEQAGVDDGGAYKVPGFAWARSNRFLASFASQLQPEQRHDWLRALRQLDRQARQHEWRNLNAPAWPLAVQVQVDQCAEQQLGQLSEAEFQKLRQQVAVPDDYSALARTLGAYPISQAFLAMGVKAYQQEVLTRFKQAQLGAEGQWVEWRLAGDEASLPTFSPSSRTDALGRWQLDESQWRQIIRQHAPRFMIDTQGAFDRPGQPRPAGEAQKPTLASPPSVYWSVSWTRFGQQVLPQLNYHLWFSQRPADSTLDFYAGALDGLIWRITLDKQGQPLVHDTIHACGCYHMVFPVRNLPRRSALPGQERSLMPQGQVPFSALTVVLDSGRHYVQRVVPQISSAHWRAQQQTLSLVSYEELLSLPTGTQNFVSLFEPNGLIAGSERLERYWLWPSGVISPGAMRQTGRHATAFLGRQHFDNPFLLEQWFLALD